uniref:Cytochrome b6-f complex subunit PetN n=1 Tax=Alexandrium monilatum TaxID=311494 RepID=A0A7S4W4K7_9DINO
MTRCALLLALGLAVPAAAYVQPASRAVRPVAHSLAAPAASAPTATAPGVEQEAEGTAAGLVALSCCVGAAVGFASKLRRSRAATAAVPAAAGLAPLAASAAGPQLESSLALATDPLNNPDLGFIFLTALTSMSIALVVWGRNGL